jgi:hypothetical protein
VCGKDFWHIAEEARWGDFSLSVFGSVEPATHLLQVAFELATKTGVLGDPPPLQDRLDLATRLLQLQVAKSFKGKLIALKARKYLSLLLPNFQKTLSYNVKYSRGGAQNYKEKMPVPGIFATHRNPRGHGNNKNLAKATKTGTPMNKQARTIKATCTGRSYVEK